MVFFRSIFPWICLSTARPKQLFIEPNSRRPGTSPFITTNSQNGFANKMQNTVKIMLGRENFGLKTV